jgi:hypothetical protein
MMFGFPVFSHQYFLAAGDVWFFESGWPDIIVTSLLAALLLGSFARVNRGALKEIRSQPDTSPQPAH